MPNNPRLNMSEENKYIYRPPFKITNRKSLLSLVKRHDLDGKGGILLSELAECIPNADKTVQVRDFDFLMAVEIMYFIILGIGRRGLHFSDERE